MATHEEKTFNFRFIERDGRRILQQEVVISEEVMGGFTGFVREWRDVPLVSQQADAVQTKYYICEQLGGTETLLAAFYAADDVAAIALALGNISCDARYMLYAEREPGSAARQLAAIVRNGAIEWQRSL